MPRAALLLAFAATLAVGMPARAQISPGDLSRAHESLEGVKNCAKCHGGGDALDAKCLDCHEAVAFLRDEGRGLHAREGRQECARCHPEHAGRDFELVEWSASKESSFDHERTGYPLEGRHAQLKCQDCHKPDNHARNVTVRQRKEDAAESWLGLDPRCVTCHTDVHQGRFEQSCASCHSSSSWQQVSDFDHASTGYALSGGHADVDCVRCHQNGRFAQSSRPEARLVLKGLPTDDCAVCHKDPHQGRFGVECARCHVVAGFRRVSGENFDHERTRYPLRGAHRQVDCARCHDTARGGWGKQPAFDRCSRCHTDAHAGTATLAGKSVDCDACHRVISFAPSTFDLAAHARTEYPLEGKHAEVECRRCHAKDTANATLGPAAVPLHPAHEACATCHTDPHAGQLVGDAARCERCHSTAAFAPSTFDLAAHASTDLPLDGAHRDVECRRCHGVTRPGLPALAADDLGKPAFALALDETSCADCHVDVHRGRYLKARSQSPPMECEVCHTADAFRPSLVDVDLHGRFAFGLKGGHRATPCFLCHSNLTDPLLESTLVLGGAADVEKIFHDVPTACEACHTEGVPR